MELERVTPAGIRATVASATERADRRVEAAVASAPVTVHGVVGGLGDAVLEIWDAFGRTAAFANLHPEADVREAAREADETLNKWRLALFARDDVGRAVRAVASAAGSGTIALDDAERAVLDRWLAETSSAGYGLDPAARAEVEAGRARLIELGVRFHQNIEDDRRTVEIAPDELDELPTELVDRLPTGSTPGSRLITMDMADRLPVLEGSANRGLRERVVRTWFDQAVETNLPVLDETIRIRRRLAELLGHASWMDLQASGAMAGSRAAVMAFVDGLVRGMGAAAAPRIAAMTERLRSDTGNPEAVVAEWDWRFYDSADLRAVGIEASVLAEYLPLDRVIDGLFELTADVLGVRVIEVAEARGWHPDVRRWQFEDVATGRLLGECLADLLPHPGKAAGAWAYHIELGPRDPDGRPRTPLMGLVAGLTPPGATGPSLLTPLDLEMLFHEFGHVLEGILATWDHIPADERWLGWDWIESASQIMEHWTSRPEIVGRFARHHRTGEPMPAALLDALPATRRIGIETTTLRQLYLARVDAAIHGPETTVDLEAADGWAWSILPWPRVDGGFYPAQLSHLHGGYDGLLYGYLWAQVYGDDMFSRFAAEGTRSPEVGSDYRREILSAPWTRPQVERLRRFLGREPSSGAFLSRLGLAVSSPGQDP